MDFLQNNSTENSSWSLFERANMSGSRKLCMEWKVMTHALKTNLTTDILVQTLADESVHVYNEMRQIKAACQKLPELPEIKYERSETWGKKARLFVVYVLRL